MDDREDLHYAQIKRDGRIVLSKESPPEYIAAAERWLQELRNQAAAAGRAALSQGGE